MGEEIKLRRLWGPEGWAGEVKKKRGGTGRPDTPKVKTLRGKGTKQSKKATMKKGNSNKSTDKMGDETKTLDIRTLKKTIIIKGGGHRRGKINRAPGEKNTEERGWSTG